MKAKFELKSWLAENREEIISNYTELTKERFFNGITLKNFMIEILTSMIRNNVKSEKRASSMLPFLMGEIYFNNSKLTGNEIKINNSHLSESSQRQLPSSMI